MRTKTIPAVLTLLAIAALLTPATAIAQAPDGPPIYVWINQLKAQPGQSDALIGMMIQQGTEAYEPLLASGAALNWGVGLNVVHDGGDATSHVEWVSFVGWEAMDQFMAAFMAKRQSMSPEELAAEAELWDSTVVDGSHFDVINRSVHLGGNLEGRPNYIHLGYFEAKPGKEGAVMDLYKNFAAPAFDQVAANGDIIAYGLHAPAVHRSYPWTHMSWYSAETLAARDAVDAALGMPDAETQARMEEVFTDRHEDQIVMVVHFSQAAMPDGGE